MIIDTEIKLQPKNILYPRTLVIEDLDIIAVFSSQTSCVVCYVGNKELVLYNENGLELQVKDALGKEIDNFFDAKGKVNKFKWQHASEENLLWNNKHALVGWQDEDDVTIVDSLYKTELIGSKVNIEDYDWCTIGEFAENIKLYTMVLSPKIDDDSIVLFDNANEMQEYIFLTTGEKSDLKNDITYPIVVSKSFTFSLSDTQAVLAHKKDIANSIGFSQWKKSSEQR